MRVVISLACLSALSLLTACTAASEGYYEGYYDANGNYIPGSNETTEAQRRRAPSPTEHGTAPYPDYHLGRYVEPYGYSYMYDRRGYYDYYGNYYAAMNDLEVPESMLPPRGMCRVWFPDRVYSAQPRVEACNRIYSRVPMGAYVIYGG